MLPVGPPSPGRLGFGCPDNGTVKAEAFLFPVQLTNPTLTSLLVYNWAEIWFDSGANLFQKLRSTEQLCFARHDLTSKVNMEPRAIDQICIAHSGCEFEFTKIKWDGANA
jgi:hypothetical protein